MSALSRKSFRSRKSTSKPRTNTPKVAATLESKLAAASRQVIKHQTSPKNTLPSGMPKPKSKQVKNKGSRLFSKMFTEKKIFNKKSALQA